MYQLLIRSRRSERASQGLVVARVAAMFLRQDLDSRVPWVETDVVESGDEHHLGERFPGGKRHAIDVDARHVVRARRIGSDITQNRPDVVESSRHHRANQRLAALFLRPLVVGNFVATNC